MNVMPSFLADALRMLCEQSTAPEFRSDSVPESAAVTGEQPDWTNGFGTLNSYEVPASSSSTMFD